MSILKVVWWLISNPILNCILAELVECLNTRPKSDKKFWWPRDQFVWRPSCFLYATIPNSPICIVITCLDSRAMLTWGLHSIAIRSIIFLLCISVIIIESQSSCCSCTWNCIVPDNGTTHFGRYCMIRRRYILVGGLHGNYKYFHKNQFYAMLIPVYVWNYSLLNFWWNRNFWCDVNAWIDLHDYHNDPAKPLWLQGRVTFLGSNFRCQFKALIL